MTGDPVLPEAIRQAIRYLFEGYGPVVYQHDFEAAILAYGQQRYREGLEAAAGVCEMQALSPASHWIKCGDRIRALLPPSPTNGGTP